MNQNPEIHWYGTYKEFASDKDREELLNKMAQVCQLMSERYFASIILR